MGKNKNKRIQKANRKPQSHPQNQQLEIEHRQGIFSNIEDKQHEPIIIQSQSEEQQPQQNVCQPNVNVNADKWGNGYLYTLAIGKLYAIDNRDFKNGQVWVLDGKIESNFKVYDHMFEVMNAHNLIFEAKSIATNKVSQNSSIKQNKKLKAQQIISRINDQAVLANLQNIHQLVSFDGLSVILFTLSSGISISEIANKSRQWQGLSISQFFEKSPKTLVIGPKNSGKSTLCQSLLNYALVNKHNLCVLDIDIGRNLYYPGTVSLTICTASPSKQQHISLWIGQFTPLNNIKLYMRAIERLLEQWKSKYFYCSLIVNTMGYLTGIGQLVLYQVYDKIKPDLLLQLNPSKEKVKNDDWSLRNIIRTIQTGEYINRLHFSFNQDKMHNEIQKPSACSTKIIRYSNAYSAQKAHPHGQHLQKYLSLNPIGSLQQLVLHLYNPYSSLKPLPSNKGIELYRKKQSGITQIQFYAALDIQMRILVLGKFWNGFVQVLGFGFGWGGQICCDNKLIDAKDVRVGVLTDGVDLEKKFYQISQNRLIQLQDIIGKKVPYLMSNYQVLGSKGMRNNPAKKNINIM